MDQEILSHKPLLEALFSKAEKLTDQIQEGNLIADIQEIKTQYEQLETKSQVCDITCCFHLVNSSHILYCINYLPWFIRSCWKRLIEILLTTKTTLLHSRNFRIG